MPRGGKRPGAGRPPGSKNKLPFGLTGAILEVNKLERKMAQLKIPKGPKGYRVPADATPEQREVADFAMDQLVQAAAGKIHSKRAPTVIKASVELRKEICGPIAIKVEQDIGGRLEKLLTQSMELPGQVVTAEVLPEKTTGQAAEAAQPDVPTAES